MNKHKKEFSIYRYQYWIQTGLSEFEAKQKVSQIQLENCKKKIKKLKPEHSQFRMEYWILKKGLSEKEAKQKISEIQSKFSANSSKFKGKIRTNESKQKISNSIKRKIGLVGKGIWAKHFGEFNVNSKIERDVFFYIKENINPNVTANVPISNYIVDILDGKKVIEFYGDFWHANPKYYNRDQNIKPFVNKTAGEIWKFDSQRIDFLRSIGYDVLVIWETDWKKDKNNCVELIKKHYDNPKNSSGN